MSRSASSRANLIKAKKIFDELGYGRLEMNVLYNTAGTPIEFDFLLAQKGFERILAPFAKNLKNLGSSLIIEQ